MIKSVKVKHVSVHTEGSGFPMAIMENMGQNEEFWDSWEKNLLYKTTCSCTWVSGQGDCYIILGMMS